MIVALSLAVFHSCSALLHNDLLARPALKRNTIENGWQAGNHHYFSVSDGWDYLFQNQYHTTVNGEKESSKRQFIWQKIDIYSSLEGIDLFYLHSHARWMWPEKSRITQKNGSEKITITQVWATGHMNIYNCWQVTLSSSLSKFIYF